MRRPRSRRPRCSRKGTLRVTAPVVFGHLYLAPMLGELLHEFPKLSLDLSLTNRFVDLIEEGMDLAIRIGQLADSRLIARRLCTNHRVLVASPSYLERWGVPERPDDLEPPPMRVVQRVSEARRMEADGAGRSGERCRRGARRHEQRRDLDQRRQTGARHHGRRDVVGRPRAAVRGAGARPAATSSSSRPRCSPSTPRRASSRPRFARRSTSWSKGSRIPRAGIDACSARSRASPNRDFGVAAAAVSARR